MKKTILSLGAVLLGFSAQQVSAHCEVPCGIYADDNVFVGLEKDQETIAKAMKQIVELSKDPGKNANQLVRWVTNKEKHAESIQQTVAQYFLAQRVKLTEAKKNPAVYAKKLAQLHEITVLAMKCKQTTDSNNADKLAKAIASFKATYKGGKVSVSGAKLGALIGGVAGHVKEEKKGTHSH